MAIKTRVVRKRYPGAITVIELPYDCTNYPAFPALWAHLQSNGRPSVIIEGRIYTEEDKATLETACEAP